MRLNNEGNDELALTTGVDNLIAAKMHRILKRESGGGRFNMRNTDRGAWTDASEKRDRK